ncbi:MAG: serine/threonine protein kinase [Myxococcales bacterium]|nr:serine/threonine protein kinase [Myxococcales bacterium]
MSNEPAEPARTVDALAGPTLAAPERDASAGAARELAGPTLAAPELTDVPIGGLRLAPGARVDRFTLLRKLGAGGMGVVYEAHDPSLDRKVALKLMLGDHEGARARLLREAQAMARLAHPNVAAVHEVGSVGEAVFIAMELIDGQTLGEWLADARGWPERLRALIAAGEGLAAAHRAGLVHRDFKPGNVMVGADGRPRVLDFGIVRSAPAPDQQHDQNDISEDIAPRERDAPGSLNSPLTRVGAIIGTPAYMAPEQLEGADVDARGDQFSYCVCAYEALYGARPHEASTLVALLEATRAGPRAPARGPVPARVFKILARGLDPDPARRWPSMRALLDALREPLERFGDPELDVSVGRRQRTALLIAMTVVLIGIVALLEGNSDPATMLADPVAGLRLHSGMTVAALLIIAAVRRWVGRNRVNRRMLMTLAVYAVMLWVNRVIGVALDIGWPEIYVLDIATWTGLTLLGGSAVHRSMYALAAAGALALGVACARASLAPPASLLYNVGSLVTVAVIWRGGRDQAAAEAAMAQTRRTRASS